MSQQADKIFKEICDNIFQSTLNRMNDKQIEKMFQKNIAEQLGVDSSQVKVQLVNGKLKANVFLEADFPANITLRYKKG